MKRSGSSCSCIFGVESRSSIDEQVGYSIHPIYQSAPHFRSKSRIFKSIAYLLDVVVAQSAAILELLAGEDQALLVRGDALLVLDLGLDVVDGVAGLDIQGNGLTRQGLDETIAHRISPCSFCLRFGSCGR
jgi:hypothetical protein